MVALLIDVSLDGHAALIAMRLGTDAWRELRDHIGVQFLHFEQVSLDRTATDDVVWRLCQQNELYLLTANRNEESEDSLQATIRREGTLHSLPVFTLADSERMYHSAAYLDKIVETLLDYLLNAENYRGAGRLYLP